MIARVRGVPCTVASPLGCEWLSRESFCLLGLRLSLEEPFAGWNSSNPLVAIDVCGMPAESAHNFFVAVEFEVSVVFVEMVSGLGLDILTAVGRW